ncbi:hypothetical protein [uncultured Shewanella sp.]|uniref:RHS repeat domain-containing protein n=1 Tax=uncultured Shewanella sp. TaxID=173975 RepID=UPI002601D589|nr:hypothetical protein [uncultured Shewanella sp.]
MKGLIKPDSFQALQRRYQYDALARITEIDEPHWGKSQFKHNANGQITQLTQQAPLSQRADVKQFDYDEVQNLTAVNQLDLSNASANASNYAAQVKAANPLVRPNSNIIDFAAKRLEKQLKYQKGGRVERIGEHTYHYDLCGRVFEKVTDKKGFRPQVTKFEWDEEDRLIKVCVPNGDTWSSCQQRVNTMRLADELVRSNKLKQTQIRVKIKPAESITSGTAIISSNSSAAFY